MGKRKWGWGGWCKRDEWGGGGEEWGRVLGALTHLGTGWQTIINLQTNREGNQSQLLYSTASSWCYHTVLYAFFPEPSLKKQYKIAFQMFFFALFSALTGHNPFLAIVKKIQLSLHHFFWRLHQNFLPPATSNLNDSLPSLFTNERPWAIRSGR